MYYIWGLLLYSIFLILVSQKTTKTKFDKHSMRRFLYRTILSQQWWRLPTFEVNMKWHDAMRCKLHTFPQSRCTWLWFWCWSWLLLLLLMQMMRMLMMTTIMIIMWCEDDANVRQYNDLRMRVMCECIIINPSVYVHICVYVSVFVATIENN